MHRIAKSADHHVSHSKRSSRSVATVRAMSDEEDVEGDDGDDAELKVVSKVRRMTHSHLTEKHHSNPRRHARTVAVVAADSDSDDAASSDISMRRANQAHQGTTEMHRLFRSRSMRRNVSHRSSRSRATVASTDGESETQDISVPSQTMLSHRGEARMASEMGRDEETVGGRREVEAWVNQEARHQARENEGEEEEGVEATARQVEADAADPDMERGFDTPSDSDPMVVPLGLISKKGKVKQVDFAALDRVS